MINNKEKVIKMIKRMTPGGVLAFMAQELGTTPSKLLLKNAGGIALQAVKSGWTKAGNIVKATKNFSGKSKADDTGIDWENVELDEAGFKLKCLFDGDSGKKLRDFVKKLGDQMKEFAEEEKKINETLSEDPTDNLAVTFLNCLRRAATGPVSGRQSNQMMWSTFVKRYAKDIGISDRMIPDILAGKTSSGDAALDGMCSIFADFKNGGKNAVDEINAMFSNKDLMDAYGSKFKSAMKYASTFKGNDIFTIGADTVMDKDSIANIADAVDNADTPKEAVAAAGASKEAAQEMANDDELKKQAEEQAGKGGAFSAIGWARLAAKTTGYVLNHGADMIDALGAKKIAKGEDKNVIAEIRTQIENDEASDKDYADSEFSVRFTVDDLSWHATCIDDRKMQVPEEILIDKVLSTDTGKKFKSYCIKKWKSIFAVEPGGEYAMLPFILKNLDKFGLKGGNREFFDNVKVVSDNLDKIEQQFN